jgi:protein-tyrosine phosphatase
MTDLNNCDSVAFRGHGNMLDFERYGGRRSYLLHLSELSKSLIGVYRPMIRIDWHNIDRLVFVCSGNICRSPYAAERARAAGANAISFGLAASDGAFADPSATRNASRRDLDLTRHRSARLLASSVRPTDLVLLFEPRQVEAFRLLEGAQAGAVSLVGLWSTPLRPHVADPFAKSDRYFQECFSIIDSGVRALCAGMLSTRAQ